MFLMIDNYDSFVYNLVRYLHELNEKVIIKRNDEITIDEIKTMNIEGIILSPGPKSPKEANLCLKIIEVFKEQIPILGVCLGHQCIGHYFGAKIIKGYIPVHGKISTIKHDGKGIYNNIKNYLKVTRYHSLIIDKESLPKDLIITSETKDGIIMGIRHTKYAIEGVQFHPEAELTEYGHEMLKNFIKLCKITGKEKGDKNGF
ncbi:anthranilate synthase component II [Clostridium tarantellae]|uniref:Aminodeoxychorismate/anthranilate synthase component II n=1 Tax=Clostridium tarantellae TaxID=39493 RepID=A0A6I1MMW8_9CLOT|nr:aminodeoxychorismate/anthranilate synthase component II [Clostridium tarantellae]MPQ44113.1 aminodeoxychorismate/anthranilate synthase component II [Clostridium tarantellae]